MADGPKGVWFDFAETNGEWATFVIKITDPDAIANARAILEGATVAAPTPMGVLEGAPASYNVGWAFHLIPASVSFYETVAEGMQSSVLGVAHDLDYWLHAFGGGWASYLTPTHELAATFGRSTDESLDGTAGADLIVARGGADLLRGGGGHDVLSGGNGADTVRGGADGDKLGGGEGRDSLVGAAGDDLLFGDAGRDTLRGGEGADRLTSDFDGDVLRGGAGADVFTAAIGVGAGGDGVRILDFSSAEGDVLDFAEIDADAFTEGDQAFTLVDALTGRSGEAAIRHDGQTTSLLLDVDGDGLSDYDILVSGAGRLEARDLVL